MTTKHVVQAVEFITNPLDDNVMGRVVVYFCGLQNHTVDTKSTRRDIIIERIRDKIHSLLKNLENNVKQDGQQPVQYRDPEVDAEQGHGKEHAAVEDLQAEGGRHLTDIWQ